MDHTRKNDRRISIVLNGKEKRYEDLQKDKQVYEELLEKEIAGSRETSEEEFDWLLTEPETKKTTSKVVDLGAHRREKAKLAAPFWDDGFNETAPKIPTVKRKKRRSFSVKSLPLAVIGIVLSAIIVGVSFGFMMLTIFTDNDSEQSLVTGGLSTADASKPATGNQQGTLPVLGVEIVQGGAYSVLEKGQEAVAALKNRSFAALLSDTTNPAYLFIGLGLDKSQATVVSESYKVAGQEVYLKPYAVQEGKILASEDEELFFTAGVKLFQQLTHLSVNGFADGGSLITEAAVAELTAAYRELSQLAAAFTENEAVAEKAAAFMKSLATAEEHLSSYYRSKEQVNLWQAQQALLEGLMAYEQLANVY